MGSDITLHFTGTDATCTNIERFGSTVHDGPYTLNVGGPTASGFSIGVAYFVPIYYTFAANLTIFCH
jgi:hypothetical protein